MLEVKNLKTEIITDTGSFCAVDDVSFSLRKGGSLGIVGESGSGKTLTSLSILRLLQSPGRIAGGQVLFEGQDLFRLSNAEMQNLRGRDLTMISQEPMSSLNPVFTIGEQIEGVIRLHHKNLGTEQVKQQALKVLRQVNLPSPELTYDQYPHQLSGGMQQRVLIALAISCNPKILIADEPTASLDVTIQSQILELLKKLKNELQLSLILITHDLAVISEMCDEILVMYAGQVVESGSVKDVFENPRHPYTRGLLDSLSFTPITGSVPSMQNLPKGCRFFDRCDRRQDACRTQNPLLGAADAGQKVACHFPLKNGNKA